MYNDRRMNPLERADLERQAGRPLKTDREAYEFLKSTREDDMREKLFVERSGTDRRRTTPHQRACDRWAFEYLREAESLMGTETTTMFLDEVDPTHRLNWLRKVRRTLKENGIEPENLAGRWNTE